MHRLTALLILATLARPLLGLAQDHEAHQDWLEHLPLKQTPKRGITVPQVSVATPLFPVIKVNQYVSNEPQNEPSVRINPTDRNNIVAAYRDFRFGGAEPAVRNVGIATTTNAGASWVEQLAAFSNHDRYSDPTVAVDASGTFYVGTLDYREADGISLSTVSIRRSFDGGITWNGAMATDGEAFHDKEMLIADDVSASPYVNNVYMAVNEGGQKFSRLTSFGAWFEPVFDIGDVGGFPTPATGPNGEVYVVGASFNTSSTVIIRSTDGGASFDTARAVSSDHIPAGVSIDGTIGSIGEPVVAADKGPGPRRGAIYVTWQSSFLGDADIFCTASTDGGTTWRAPIRVNTDSLANGRDQFHHWMTVDDSGWIDVVFLDRRNDPANIYCDAYFAQSRDGGWSFKNYRLTAQNFDPRLYPSGSARLGDYMGIDARLGRIVPIWVDTHLGNEDVYIALIDSVPVGRGSIGGMAFNDVNINGILDAHDSILPNWQIYLSGGGEVISTRTDANGHYAFSDLLPGTYTVTQEHPNDWFQVVPYSPPEYSIGIYAGESSDTNTFANTRTSGASISAIPHSGGWNLLSLPRDPADRRTSAVYPASSSRAFEYSGAYVQLAPPRDTLSPGRGYWLKFPAAGKGILAGDSLTDIQVDLQPDWNIIGTATAPALVGGISTNPPGIIISNFFAYIGGGYTAENVSLKPGFGYWVKTSQSGTMTIHSAAISSVADAASSDVSPLLNKLTFEDAGRHRTTLRFGGQGSAPTPAIVELPPKPPAGGFDVRFSDQTSVGIFRMANESNRELEINVQTLEWPVRVFWELTDHANAYSLRTENPASSQLLDHDGTLLLRNADESVLLLSRSSSPVRNGSFTLLKNYPNPFNPSTTIGFDIPASARVTAKIYSLLGEEVATLADQQLFSAGRHEFSFTAGASLASGAYFCRVAADDEHGKKEFGTFVMMYIR